jgi:hypothetical protein
MDKRWHSGIGQLATIFNVAYIKERKDDIHKYYLIINTPTRDLFQPYRMDPGKRATNARRELSSVRDGAACLHRLCPILRDQLLHSLKL